jgi:hypothetical protein
VPRHFDGDETSGGPRPSRLSFLPGRSAWTWTLCR